MNIFELIENHEWSKDRVNNRAGCPTTVEFFTACLQTKTSEELAEHFGVSVATIHNWLKKYPELPKIRFAHYNKVSAIFELKKCAHCLKFLPYDLFTKDDTGAFGIGVRCKECDTKRRYQWVEENREHHKAVNRNRWHNGDGTDQARNARRRAAKLQRTAAWADHEKIKEIYANCPKGYEVDHILPLQGELVSGLHVPENLQYLTKADNVRKKNKYVPG